MDLPLPDSLKAAETGSETFITPRRRVLSPEAQTEIQQYGYTQSHSSRLIHGEISTEALIEGHETGRRAIGAAEL